MNETLSLPKFIENPDPFIYVRSSNYVVVDIETTSDDKGNAREPNNEFLYMSLYHPLHGWLEAHTLPEVYALMEIICSADFVVAQNAKFELKWFWRWGFPIHKLLIYDTMIGDYVRAGNRGWELHLNALAARYNVKGKLNTVSRLIELGMNPKDIPYSWLTTYCKQDVKTTLEVFLKQREHLFENGLLPVFFIRCLVTPLLSELEMRGLHLDEEVVQEELKTTVATYHDLTLRLNALTGGINMGSPKQVAHFMYKDLKLPTPRDWKGREILKKPSADFPEGVPATDAKVIPDLLKRARTERQKEFLTLKMEESKVRKKITTYLNRFSDVCKTKAQILYGTYNQVVSDTHRLTSSDPNLQNLDRKLKKAINARFPDWLIVNADYKQLEFRTAGQLANDPQAIQDVKDNVDVHTRTGEIIGCGRQNAKAHTFKPLYGGSSGTENERKYYEWFKNHYKAIAAMQQGWLDQVLETKKLVMPTGLIMYYPDTEYNATGTYVTNTSKIFNHPVQQFATADIAPIGSVLLWHHLKASKLQSFMINAVHDSSLLEVHPKEVEQVTELCHSCMSKKIVPFFKKVINFDITFPFDIDVEVKSNWGWDKAVS